MKQTLSYELVLKTVAAKFMLWDLEEVKKDLPAKLKHTKNCVKNNLSYLAYLQDVHGEDD